MNPTLDGSENNQLNPDVESSNADSEAEENNANTENQAAVDVPSWVVGHWFGHRRALDIHPDGSGSLGSDLAAAAASDQTIQLIDSSESGGKGTMPLKVISSRNEGPDTTGKIYSFEAKNGIASLEGSVPFCKMELPEYKAEYRTMPMCGA